MLKFTFIFPLTAYQEHFVHMVTFSSASSCLMAECPLKNLHNLFNHVNASNILLL